MDNAVPIDIIDEQDIGWTRTRADRGPTPARRRVEEGEQARRAQRTEQGNSSDAASSGERAPAGDPGPGGP
eukprot:8750836-Lingulodinium_polyedra.AAC.1